MRLDELVEWVWYARSPGAAAARAGLLPAELLFRAGAAVRSAAYGRGLARAAPLGAPALSVGNLTVGGTGKTPVAAWACAELAARGARPALLLRGVGGDEARVHALLNPAVPVFAGADRTRSARRAVDAGATALVLDDAFQHRRARRDLDWVLVSAERAGARPRLLPAGPFREGVRALARAGAVLVTRKSAPAGEAEAVARAVAPNAAGAPAAVVHLVPDVVRAWTDAGAEGAERPLGEFAGALALVVAGVGDPGPFAAQLRAAGARVDLARYPDHHAYDEADVARLVARARGADAVLTTLKDAVKLGPRWPREGPPLWYVSQRVTVERGAEALGAQLDALAAAARPAGAPRAATSEP